MTTLRSLKPGLGLYAGFYLAFLYLPVLFLPVFSFNDGTIIAFSADRLYVQMVRSAGGGRSVCWARWSTA